MVYFILSKVLLCLIFPLTWVFLLLLLAVFFKKTTGKRRSIIGAIVLLFVFSNNALESTMAHLWNINQFPKSNQTFSAAIILGGFSGEDEKGEGHFNWAADRFIQGLRLYDTHVVKYILITSGNGNLNADEFREATWAKQQMEQLNVPDSALLIESNSRNTIENAKFSLALLQKAKIKGPYLLVTSAFHMRRAQMIFKKEHIDVVPYSCNYTGSGKLNLADWIIPSVDALADWNIYLKEMVGYAVNSFNA